MGWLMRLLTGGVIEQFTKPLLEAHRMRLAAQNDSERFEAEQAIARLEVARDIALAEAQDRWSATRIGRLLIVVPFGLWWAAIYLVQIINPWFGLSLVVIDVPARIHDMALILVPAIIIGDAGALVARRIRR
jgi:hypothetical protein